MATVPTDYNTVVPTGKGFAGKRSADPIDHVLGEVTRGYAANIVGAEDCRIEIQAHILRCYVFADFDTKVVLAAWSNIEKLILIRALATLVVVQTGK